MKQIANRWLSQSVAGRGLLAGAILYPDKTIFSQNWSAKHSPESWESLCHRLAAFTSVLRQQRLPEQRLYWQFEDSCIGYLRRSDGVSLFGWSQCANPSEPPIELKAILDEFSVLSLASISPL